MPARRTVDAAAAISRKRSHNRMCQSERRCACGNYPSSSTVGRPDHSGNCGSGTAAAASILSMETGQSLRRDDPSATQALLQGLQPSEQQPSEQQLQQHRRAELRAQLAALHGDEQQAAAAADGAEGVRCGSGDSGSASRGQAGAAPSEVGSIAQLGQSEEELNLLQQLEANFSREAALEPLMVLCLMQVRPHGAGRARHACRACWHFHRLLHGVLAIIPHHILVNQLRHVTPGTLACCAQILSWAQNARSVVQSWPYMANHRLLFSGGARAGAGRAGAAASVMAGAAAA